MNEGNNRQDVPLVSIIMAVFNGEDYLASAIESILQQTFRDFEYIIVNDGSTDKSQSIIERYAQLDKRIKVIKNKTNMRLVYCLNKAVEVSRGKYIARMDSDDIALPTRLKEEVNFIEKHDDCDVLTTQIQLVDQNNLSLPLVWPEDMRTNTPEEIRDQMPKNNCISHPTVIARSSILKLNPYRAEQLHGEDYDLWLRLLSKGKKFYKLNKPLLRYRFHDNSVTQRANVAEGRMKVMRLKSNFLIYQFRHAKFGSVERAVLKSLIKDSMNYTADNSNIRVLKLSAKVSRKFISLINKLAKIPSATSEKKNIQKQYFSKLNERTTTKTRILFVLPWLSPGGVDKLMLDLIKSLHKDYIIDIITTYGSEYGWEYNWAGRFKKYVDHLINLSDIVNHQSNMSFYIAQFCNSYKVDIALISNTEAGYRATSKIKRISPKTKLIDILHGQGGKNDDGSAPRFMQPYETNIDQHITVTSYLKQYLQDKYSNPSNKITVIANGVDTSYFNPTTIKSAHAKKALRIPVNNKVIVWIGRFGQEKHPEIFIEIADLLVNTYKQTDLTFIMAGDGPLKNRLEEMISEKKLGSIVLLPGFIKDAKSVLVAADLLVMTSEMEGMPLVLLEAGSMGVPAIAPDVGGISEVVKDGKNGLLIKYDTDLAKNISIGIQSCLSGKTKLDSPALIRKNTASRFGLKKMVREYEEILKR